MRFIWLFSSLLVVVKWSTACPAGCSCIADEIACSYRGLSSLPHFTATDFNNVKVFDLSYNNLKTLPANAFQAAKVETLRLNGNRLSYLDNDTFKGLETTLQNLDISDNRLTSLPDALGFLDSLKSLNVSNNFNGSRNLELTDSVMRAIGDTVTEFVFGSIHQSTWPKTLGSHLQTLERLEVTSLDPSLLVIPPRGFYSFESTLQTLSIHNTNLLAVPLGISNLRHLKTLNYDYNLNTQDKGILLQSFPTGRASRLTTLTLRGDSLTQFPLVLKYLPNLRKFGIDDNPLELVGEETVKGMTQLQELSIRNCSLERIPAALSEITNLRVIDFSFNSIESVEQRDLSGFGHIQKLILSNTPLKYLSQDSLIPLTSLQELEMNNTQLTIVPLAVNATPSHVKISLGNNRLDCMCETLAWLLYKEVKCNSTGSHPFQVVGECDTIHSTLQDYLVNFAPNCPAYKEKCNILPYINVPNPPFRRRR